MPLFDRELPEGLSAVAFSPEGNRIAAATFGGTVALVDAKSGALLRELPGHAGGTLSVSFSPDGEHLATGGQDGHVRVYALASGEELHAWEAGGAWVEHVLWSPSGGHLAAAAGRSVRIWSHRGTPKGGYEQHAGTVTSIQWSASGTGIISSCNGGIHRLEAGRKRPLETLDAEGAVLAVAISPDRKFIAAGRQDSSIRLWAVRGSKAVSYDIPGYRSKVRALAWNAASNLLATGDGAEVAVWELGTRMSERQRAQGLTAHSERVTGLAVRQDGPNSETLLSTGHDGQLCGWNPTQGRRPLWALQAGVALEGLTLSPDKSLLAAIGAGGHLLAWSFAPPAQH
ncbi:WD40 repeat domain-containing protein [Myxococcus sp. AB036A]|uniref:WD40 repeat domain-containing protein n=1 Tax=Myxococcus sp. AB036A TaxID=2562793 RepID=UPI0018918014|nr:WD40 repeat domain-containing protein [Myxococcus sp. AB036A]